MERNAVNAIDDVVSTLGDLWRTAAAAAPGCDLTQVLSCEQHGLVGVKMGLLHAPGTLESADGMFIEWLDSIQATVYGARDRIRAGAPGEGLAALDTVSLALTTYSATRRLRMHAIGEWNRLAHGGDGDQESWPVRPHRLVYSTRDLAKFEFNWIEGWLLAGRNPLTVLDVDLLLALGITHVLDLREEKEWRHPRFGTEAVTALRSNGVKRLHVPVPDTHRPAPEQFEAACNFLAAVEQQPGARAYVHCRAGWERTATILTAYYARRDDVPWRDALGQLQLRRRTFRLWPEQESAVRVWIRGLERRHNDPE